MRSLTLLSIMLYASMPVPLKDAVTPARSSGEQTACPPDDRYTRFALEGALLDPGTRALWGMGEVTPADLRVLTDETDILLCHFFRENVTQTPGGSTSVQWGYYEAGGFYFVSVRRVNSGDFGLGNSAMWVFNSELQELGVYAM